MTPAVSTSVNGLNTMRAPAGCQDANRLLQTRTRKNDRFADILFNLVVL